VFELAPSRMRRRSHWNRTLQAAARRSWMPQLHGWRSSQERERCARTEHRGGRADHDRLDRRRVARVPKRRHGRPAKRFDRRRMLLGGPLPSGDDNDHRDERRGVYDKCGSDADGGDEQAGNGRSDDRRRVVFDAVQCGGSRPSSLGTSSGSQRVIAPDRVVARSTRKSIAQTKSYVDQVTLPPDSELPPALADFFQAFKRPGTLARATRLERPRLNVISDLERHLGRRIVQAASRS
jgi:hypothetical protein